MFLFLPGLLKQSPAELSHSTAGNRVKLNIISQNSSQSCGVQGADSTQPNLNFAFDKSKCNFIKSAVHTHDRLILIMLLSSQLLDTAVYVMFAIRRLEISTPWVSCQHFISQTCSSRFTPIFCFSLLSWPQADGTLYCKRCGGSAQGFLSETK